MEQFDLVGVDGNAFSVMGYVINAMRKCTSLLFGHRRLGNEISLRLCHG